MQHFIHTEPGDGHGNEDAVLVRRHPHAAEVLVCALADGQGGQSGGRSAAHVGVADSVGAAGAVPAGELFDAASWYAIVGSADAAVDEADDAGFTTLVALCVDGKRVQGASCGDSAAVLLQGGQAAWLTEDQRKNPPIGSGEAIPVAFHADLNGLWKLLLISDGVWRYVGYESIAKIAAERDGDALIATLRQAALDGNGGKLGDDFSVILVQSP